MQPKHTKNRKESRMHKLIIIIISLFGLTLPALKAQKVSIKNNLAYTAITFTPNLGVEVSLGEKYSINIHTSYNPWNYKGHSSNNKKLAHWVIQPEFRYWFKQATEGHYMGIHGLFSRYNISQRKLNILFGNHSEDYRFDGNANGAGLTYGYQWNLSKRWSLETNLGIGFLYMNYDKYDARKCGKWIETKNKTYVGPTKIGVHLIYKLN